MDFAKPDSSNLAANNLDYWQVGMDITAKVQPVVQGNALHFQGAELLDWEKAEL